jgi:protein O-GlcNAc transferase
VKKMDDPKPTLERARAFAAEGKYLHALQMYVSLVERKPENSETFFSLARFLSDTGHEKAAAGVLLRGLMQHPRDPDFLLALGDHSAAQGRHEEAVRWYRRLGKRCIPRVHYSLASEYLALGRVLAAEREIRTAVRLQPRFAGTRELLGEILLRKNFIAPAVEELRLAVRLDPYNGNGHRLLGAALLASHRVDEALGELVLAVDIRPDDAEAWQLCGEALARLRRFSEAEYYLSRALALAPSSPEASTSLGFLRLHRGDRPGARAAFDAALRIRPGHPRALDGRLSVNITSE